MTFAFQQTGDQRSLSTVAEFERFNDAHVCAASWVLAYFISPYSEFRNIPSIYCELASRLGFIGQELGILKRGGEGPLRIGGLAQCTFGYYAAEVARAAKFLN
jgi:hypothetical protein